MPILVLRPNESLGNGTWNIVGPAGTTLHGALADDNDATYVQNTGLAQLETQIFKVGLSDVSLPVGSKIFSVGVRVRVQQVAPTDPGDGGGPKPPPRCIIFWIQKVIYSILTRQYDKFFRLIFGFHCPRPKPPPTPTDPPPPVAWETIELAKYLQQPAGGEWTQQSFNDFVFGMGRDDATDPARISSVYVDVEYNTPPVVTVTGPTGSISDTTTPTVTWTYADQESDRQQSSQVRIFSQEQYTASGFDPLASTAFAESNWVIGEDTQWTITRDLPNGNWRAYVQVEQVWLGIGTHRSNMAFVQWAQTVPGPPNPHLNAFFELDLNRVRLELTEGGPSPETITYNLYSSDNAGISWDLVRDGYQIGVAADRSAQIWDYEAPIKRLRQYRAQAFRQMGVIRVASGFSNTVSVTPESEFFWFKDVLVPVRNRVVPLVYDDHKMTRDQGFFRPIVAEGVEARVIPVTGPVYGREGTFQFIFTELDPETWWDDFHNLWKAGTTILYQLTNAEQYYVRLGKELKVSEWLMREDEVRYRRVEVDYVEVEKPAIEMTLVIVTS